jgi:adiponectin receptor
MDFITVEKVPQPTLSEAETPQRPPPPLSSRLLTYDELPSWHRDSPLIAASYRPISYSVLSSLRSSLRLHNETLNIHTHSLPCLLCLFFTGFIVYLLQLRYPQASRADKAVFSAWFALSATCLGFSAVYHTLMNHSQRVAGLWLKLDFVGIVIMILGDFGSGIYVAFYCEGKLRVVYWSIVCCVSFLEEDKSRRTDKKNEDFSAGDAFGRRAAASKVSGTEVEDAESGLVCGDGVLGVCADC